MAQQLSANSIVAMEVGQSSGTSNHALDIARIDAEALSICNQAHKSGNRIQTGDRMKRSEEICGDRNQCGDRIISGPRTADRISPILHNVDQSSGTVSWASVVRNAKKDKVGFDLKYIPPSDNSKVTISPEDVVDGCNKWKNGLLGMVLGTSVSYFSMRKYVDEHWKGYGNIQIQRLKTGVFVFLFDSEDGKKNVLEKGPWLFFSKVFILKPWSPNADFSGELVKTLPIWIRLNHLKFHYFSADVLSKIASVVGIPLLVDSATASQSRLDFARICVEVNPNSSFPTTIPITNEYGMEESIEVEYEWKPAKCDRCGIFGHSNANCPLQPKGKRIWVPKKINNPTEEAEMTKEVPKEQPTVQVDKTPMPGHQTEPVADEGAGLTESKRQEEEANPSRENLEQEDVVTPNRFQLLREIEDQQTEPEGGNNQANLHVPQAIPPKEVRHTTPPTSTISTRSTKSTRGSRIMPRLVKAKGKIVKASALPNSGRR